MNLDYLNALLGNTNNYGSSLNKPFSTANPNNAYMQNFGQFDVNSDAVNMPTISATGSAGSAIPTYTSASSYGLNSAYPTNGYSLDSFIDTQSGLGSDNNMFATDPKFNTDGWFAQNKDMLNFGAQAVTGLASLYGAYNTSKANDAQLALARDQYNTNLNNYRQLTNADMSDRQARRVAANPNAESVESYMKKWGV